MNINTKALTPFLNSRQRPHLTKIDTVVLHHSAGGTLSGAVGALRTRGLSYHYLIDKDGTIYKGCPSEHVAYHAGISVGPQGKNVNSYSIGICFIHEGAKNSQLTMHQIAAAIALVRHLKYAAFKDLKWLTSHRLITMDPDRSGRSRKIDVRPFDAAMWCANMGLELWEPWEGASNLPF